MDATPKAPESSTAPKRTTSTSAKRGPGRPRKAPATRGAAHAETPQPRDAFGNEAPRPVGRPVARREMRGEVVGRDGTVLTRRRDGSGAIGSEFDIPEELRDPDWEVQGVRTSVFGKPDPKNVNDAYAAGFRPISRKHYPGIFPDLTGDVIERDGIMLMERPAELARQAAAEGLSAAHDLRHAQVDAFGEAFNDRKLPKGFESGRRSGNGKFDASRKIKRTHEIGTGNAYTPTREYAMPGDD